MTFHIIHRIYLMSYNTNFRIEMKTAFKKVKDSSFDGK